MLLDEAYIEFVAPQHRIDGPDLVRQFPNVIVLRTFSKAYGLAGLRIGYGFASPELATILWKMQLPFGMGITSLVAVSASYDAEDQLRQRILRITGERDYLRRRLRAMGVYTTDSHANFVYLPPRGRPWREVFDEAGLKARHYADGGARITVGARRVHPSGAGRGGKVDCLNCACARIVARCLDCSALSASVRCPHSASGPHVRWEKAWPHPIPTTATRSLSRGPTGNAPDGAKSRRGWSR